MSEGCFSSPVIATIRGERQLVVQSREKLAGLALSDGRMLWSQSVPSFRGMNILTPTVVGDAVFTSSYQNKGWLYEVTRDGEVWGVKELWSSTAQGYMSSPIVIGGHAYLHLANNRFTCVNLATGERTWTSDAFGKYVSLVAQGNRILGLDERGILLLIEADPKEFRLIGQHKVAESEAWAHLAICGDEVFVRELKAMSVFRWKDGQPERVASAGSP
jgi:outer membrane protein assembly factor BamB